MNERTPDPWRGCIESINDTGTLAEKTETSGRSTGVPTGRVPDMAAETMAEEERARHITMCRWEADRWRRQAGHIRDHATLLRNSDICEQEAAYWEAGAREHEI